MKTEIFAWKFIIDLLAITISSLSLEFNGNSTSLIIEKFELTTPELANLYTTPRINNENFNLNNKKLKKMRRYPKIKKKKGMSESLNFKHLGNSTLVILSNNVNENSTNVTERTLKKKRRKFRRRKFRKNKGNNSSSLIEIPGVIPLKTNLPKIGKIQQTTQIIKISTTSMPSVTISRPRSVFCQKHNGGCSQVCNETSGKIKCSCFEGFHLKDDETTCEDIDECQVHNGGCASNCTNTLGSYSCYCHEGFRLSDDHKSCEDFNECRLRNGHGFCQDTCKNTIGSYQCSCENLPGTRLNLADGRTCDDLDECSIQNGGCSHVCINAFGTSFCSCPGGFALSSDWRTCQDVNECETEDCNGVCMNTEGSYKCLTYRDLQQDPTPIANVACRPLFPPSQGYISCTKKKSNRRIVVNSPGTICKLICPPGFKLRGNYRLVCGITGQWKGTKTGRCVRKKRKLNIINN